MHTKAQEKYQQIRNQVKQDIEALVTKGMLDEAKITLSKYEELFPSDNEIYSIKAAILLQEGNMAGAEEIIKNGLDINANSFDLLYNMAYLSRIKGQDIDALFFLRKASRVSQKALTDETINEQIAKMEEILEYPDEPFKNSVQTELRILQGTMEIANQMNTLNEGLKNIGLQAESVNYYPSFLGYKSDYAIDLNEVKHSEVKHNDYQHLLNKLITGFDIYHFHFGTSLIPDNSDLPYLKNKNKRIFMHHWGSDVRLLSKAVKYNQFVQLKNNDEENTKRSLELIASSVSDCIVADMELYEYVKDFYARVHIIPQAIKIEDYSTGDDEKKQPGKKLLFVHAPTSPEIKGTRHILKAIKELQQEYDFEFKLVAGISHEEAKRIYRSADVILDQLLIGSYGLLAIEAMAMGKPVICCISDYMKENYPNELPIISANPQNIKAVLKYILKNQDMLSEIGVKGKLFVGKYHDVKVVCKKLLKLYLS